MAERSQLKEVPKLDEVEEFGHTEFHILGKLYQVDEVEAKDYEEIARQATEDEEGTVDMALLTKLLTLKAVTRDGTVLDPEAWSHEKFTIVNRVQNEVRRMHYVERETDEEITERKKAEAKAAVDAKKAAKGPDLPNS